MNALKSLVSGLITAASTALILFGSGAHGQEVKDPATLPPIETIDAQTDITVFLQNGVPNELRRAALRRAWTVDPAIRDFRGCRRTPGISTTPTASRALANSAPRSMSKGRWRRFLVRLRAWRSPLAADAARRIKQPFVSHQYLNVIFDVNDIVDQPKRSASCRR